MKIQIDDQIQTATAEQIALVQAIQSAPTIEAQAQAKQEARAVVLAKLGLTAEEAVALLS
jgi:hypothetical protein